MVVFNCSHIEQTLKYQIANRASWRCEQDVYVSCIDCRKNLVKLSNSVPITKYKQAPWLKTIRAMDERVKDQSPGVKKVFEIMKRNDNIPRKKQQFVCFFLNSSSGCSKEDIETAWSLTEQEFEEQKKLSNPTNDQEKKLEIAA
uniref:Uncharacterized protein n=1 Tax=Anopheles funestus TaxID=62324 RepID=A0A4Y0BI82_ANOFN